MFNINSSNCEPNSVPNTDMNDLLSSLQQPLKVDTIAIISTNGETKTERSKEACFHSHTAGRGVELKIVAPNILNYT